MSAILSDKFARTARLLVKVSAGVCTLADGQPLPKMKADTVAELIISPWAITDEIERARLLKEHRVEFLPAGTSIWARVKDAQMPVDLVMSCKRKVAWPKNPGLFVEIQLVSAVVLIIRGDGRAALGDCNCRIPTLPEEECASINEAYTRISVAFEPSRRSHTGNIFNCVFYEPGRSLFPLRQLRDEKLAQSVSELPFT